MSYKRYTEQIVAILNGRPDIRHPHYETHLSDAITIALDKMTIRFERLDTVQTLEQVRDLLCENHPPHTWIQGAVSIELIDAVLSIAPTHFSAKVGAGRHVTVRLANKDDFSEAPLGDGKRFIMDKFVNIQTGRLVAVTPAEVDRLDGMRLTAPAFKCMSDAAGLAPSQLIATLMGSGLAQANAEDPTGQAESVHAPR